MIDVEDFVVRINRLEPDFFAVSKVLHSYLSNQLEEEESEGRKQHITSCLSFLAELNSDFKNIAKNYRNKNYDFSNNAGGK